MKRILLITLLILATIKINAEDYNINFECDIEPSYSVLLPTVIDVSNVETQITYFVKGDIYANQILHIDFDSQCDISSSKAQATVLISQAKNTWTYSELTSSYSSSSATLLHPRLSSGRWSGEFSIRIYLQEGV